MQRRHFIRRAPSGGVLTFIILVALLFVVAQGILMVERNLRPAIVTVASIIADGLATDAINFAILEHFAGINYKDLVTIEKDEQGRIVMARVNTMAVNRLMAETTLTVNETLLALEAEPFEIPLGEVINSYILATYGPTIPVQMVPMGRVNTELVDSFEQAGINQTRHKIYLRVYTEVQIIIPFVSDSVEVVTTVPIADSIYIGEVPDTVITLSF
jgi:sporulation protein YunB